MFMDMLASRVIYLYLRFMSLNESKLILNYPAGFLPPSFANSKLLCADCFKMLFLF